MFSKEIGVTILARDGPTCLLPGGRGVLSWRLLLYRVSTPHLPPKIEKYLVGSRGSNFPREVQTEILFEGQLETHTGDPALQVSVEER